MILEIESIQQELAQAIREMDRAEDNAKASGETYSQALEAWREANKALVEAHEASLERLRVARAHMEEIRSRARGLLEESFVAKDELPTGFEQVREKQVVYDAQGLLKAALSFAPFLLKVDDAAVKKFVLGIAVEDKQGSFSIPESYRIFLPIDIATKPQARISDTTLRKVAPIAEPVVVEVEVGEFIAVDQKPIAEAEPVPF